MTISTDRDKVRLLIGDTDTNAQLFQDDELAWFLSEVSDDIYKAGALAAESAAGKFARAYDFETDGQSFKRGQMFKFWTDLAARLRSRARAIP